MSKRLQPFFSYYGSKWRAAPLYPAPEHSAIIEPFAGSACYSLMYPDRHVELWDTSEYVCGVWDYLIHTPESEIMQLPVDFESTDDLNIPQEAKWLIGFWIARANDRPKTTPTEWRNRWNIRARKRIADQQQYIRQWFVFHGDYSDFPCEADATWFIDPPYSTPAGRKYKHNQIDYEHLAQWCKSRKGQVIVCEQSGADWLDFQPFKETFSCRGFSKEVIWTDGMQRIKDHMDKVDHMAHVWSHGPAQD